jgi:peptide/nickel transport system ATP-binding protein
MGELLRVDNLTVEFALRRTTLTAVDRVSFSLEKGQRLGLVGESGAGKSVTGFSLINLISAPGRIGSGSIRFEGRELVGLSDEQMRTIRGNRITMIFQDPMMTLNPVLTIGTQMVETLQAHGDISTTQAKAVAVDKLKLVQIPSPEKRLTQYPHEFSGGMRQRIVIAIALLTEPALIIADEPTTALDVTIQAEIMDLLISLCISQEMGLILITHDLGVVSEVTEKIAVMYAGRIVESGPTHSVINTPAHPYTKGLVKAIPGSLGPGEPLHQIPGMMPTLTGIPPGCSFHPRCGFAGEICTRVGPDLRPDVTGHRETACHLVSGELPENERGTLNPHLAYTIR